MAKLQSLVPCLLAHAQWQAPCSAHQRLNEPYLQRLQRNLVWPSRQLLPAPETHPDGSSVVHAVTGGMQVLAAVRSCTNPACSTPRQLDGRLHQEVWVAASYAWHESKSAVLVCVDPNQVLA